MKPVDEMDRTDADGTEQDGRLYQTRPRPEARATVVNLQLQHSLLHSVLASIRPDYMDMRPNLELGCLRTLEKMTDRIV